MKNALKLRIIHSIKDNAEAEYLIEFFRFIGCLVHDEVIAPTFRGTLLQEWLKHLETLNEPQGVDIVLNYYHDDPYERNVKNANTERIYMYFSLDDKRCIVSKKTLRSNDGDTSSSKKSARHLALRFLIDEIWKNDSINMESIQNIGAYYTCTNGIGDLFYVLQELKCFSILRATELVRVYYDIEELKERERIIYQPIHPYTEKMLSMLYENLSLLQGDNPYIFYARINTSLQILALSKLIKNYDKRECVHRISIYKLLQDVETLIGNHEWFITAYELMADIYIYENSPVKSMMCHKMMSSSYTSFPYYYTSSICKEGEILYVMGDKEEARKRYELAVKINPRGSIAARFKIAQILAAKGNFKGAEYFLEDTERDTECFGDFFSNIIWGFRAQSLLAFMNLNSCREYSMKNNAYQMVHLVRDFQEARIVSKVADNSEADFAQFMEFHKRSMSSNLLFKLLELWCAITKQKELLSM